MAEMMPGGYAVEYICRVIDETDRKESVPETPTVAVTNSSGKKGASNSGKKAAEEASESSTSVILNSSLRVATPVLNGLTDGVAGQVIGKGKQAAKIVEKVATGAGTAAIIGAAAPIIAMAVSAAVSLISKERQKNEALAQSLEVTNLQRQAAGLSKIEYTQKGLLKKVRMGEDR